MQRLGGSDRVMEARDNCSGGRGIQEKEERAVMEETKGKEGEPPCHWLAAPGEVCLVYRAAECGPTRPKLRRVQRIPFGPLLNELRVRAKVTSLCPAVQVKVASRSPRVKRPIIHPELQVRAAEARVRVPVQGSDTPADAT